MDYCIKTNFQPDAIHVHEWGGVAGALAKTVYKEHFENIPVTLTIHNISYDFHCTSRHASKIGLPPEDFNIEGYEFWGKVSMLKAAILYSSKVVFTSPSYLFYMLSVDLPGGMRGFLESQGNKLLGIQNGVDYNTWNLPKDYEAFKKKKKDEFRAELGLEASSGILLYSHLDSDLDASAQIISTILANLLNMNLQLAIGISEDNENYPYFVAMQEKNRSKIALLPFTDNEESLCHRLSASDAFFSISTEDPSLSFFLKAAAVGSMPISGKRTDHAFTCIKPFTEQSAENKDKASAFISANAFPDLILEQIRLAESIFCENKSLWSKLVSNAVSIRATWDDTAKKYFSTFVPNS
jgi:starch synthase